MPMYDIYKSNAPNDYEFWAMIERDKLVPVAKFKDHGWAAIGFGVKATFNPKVFKKVKNEHFLKQ